MAGDGIVGAGVEDLDGVKDLDGVGIILMLGIHLFMILSGVRVGVGIDTDLVGTDGDGTLGVPGVEAIGTDIITDLTMGFTQVVEPLSTDMLAPE